MHRSHYWQIGKPALRSRRGIVTAQNMEAARAGAEILARGGNAVDAAVAAAFALGVVEPWMSGLGGGGFMLVYRAAERRVHVVDFSLVSPRALKKERYPLAAGSGVDRDMFGWPRVEEDRNLRGYESICTPGTVDGLALALTRFGSRAWAEVLAPAIRLSEEGLALDWLATLAFAVSAAELKRDPAARARFLPDGLPPAAGTTREPARLHLPELARTLHRLAEAGPRDFYEGRLAAQVAEEIRAGGGCLDEGDLRAYHAAIREPLVFDYRGATVHAAPGLCGGPTLARALAALASGTIRNAAPAAEDYQAYARVLLEAYRHRLAFLGHEAPGSCTTHVNAVDEEGNLVALTNTLLARFGAKVLLPSSGILMNNGMMWFDPRPGRPNSIAAGVRPLANMCPVVLSLADGRQAALGAAGGRQIVPSLVQIISFLTDFGMTLEEAFHRPRLDVSGAEGVTYDERLPAATARALAEATDAVPAQATVFPVRFSVPSAVLREPGSGFNLGLADPNQPLAGAAEAGAA